MKKNSQYISETNHLKDEYLSLYTEALVLDKVKDLPNEVTEHVEDCLDCKQSIIEGYDVLKNTEIDIEDHPFFNKESIHPKKNFSSIVYRIAASIVFIVSVSTIAFYMFNTKHKLTEKISHKISNAIDSTTLILENETDSIAPKQEIKIAEGQNSIDEDLENVLAENIMDGQEYQISPMILSMLGATSRSGYFEVNTPEDSTLFEINQTIIFKWEHEVNEDIKLKIFNYKDELIFESELLESNIYTLAYNLNPGAYIWKIESDNELYHLGLFFIKK